MNFNEQRSQRLWYNFRQFVRRKWGKHKPRWQCRLRRRSAAVRLLRLWVRIPLRAWLFVSCVCVLYKLRPLRRADHSFRGILPILCVCVCVYVCVCEWVCLIVCDVETSTMRRSGHKLISCATKRSWGNNEHCKSLQWLWEVLKLRTCQTHSKIPRCLRNTPSALNYVYYQLCNFRFISSQSDSNIGYRTNCCRMNETLIL